MLVDILVCIVAVAIGVITPFSFTYLEKLTAYLSKKKEKGMGYKFLDIFYTVIGQLGFGVIFVAPGLLVSNFFGQENIGALRHTLNLYLVALFISFFITLFILIKTGKLKGNKKD
jgi:drug/metabolite transporter (DMT)-like permease